MEGVYIEILGFWGVYIVKFTKRPEILTRLRVGLKSINVLGPFDKICYIYHRITQISLYTLPIKKLVFLNNLPKNLLSKKLKKKNLGPLFLIMCLINIKSITDIYYPKNWDNFHNKTLYFSWKWTYEINLNLYFLRFQKKNYLIFTF